VLQLRIDLANKALAHIENVEVMGFNKLTVDFAKDVGARVILKGIRTMSDFEYEFQMLNMNRALQPGLETIFLAPSEKFSYISSTLVRQIAALKGDITQFVHPVVATSLENGDIS
jgi:pantetheine-phosphate adenylyltransferase